MKKLLFVSFMLILSIHVDARKYSKVSITPRIGMNILELVGGSATYDSNTFFTGGVDVEYRPFSFAGVSLGGYYITMSKGVDYSCITTYVDDTNLNEMVEKKVVDDVATKNLQIPLMLNFHFYKGWTAKIGVQYNWLSAAKMNYNYKLYIQEEADEPMQKWKFVESGKRHESIMSKYCRSTLTMPIAISYEFKNVELELRHNIGACGLASKGYSNPNKAVLLTVGYRFRL